MKHKHIIPIFLFVLILASPALTIGQEAADLSNPGLTPTSPFYFMDRFGDWLLLNVLTLNQAKKAEVKIKIAEERLAELNEVFEKDPEKTDIIEKLEIRIEEKIKTAHQTAEKLDSENRKAESIIRGLSDFSLKRQRVLERVIENVPEQTKDKIEIALENIYQRSQKHRDLLLKQKQKGFISENGVNAFIEKHISNLKNQLQQRKERLDEIKDEELKERLENIIEKKIEALEDGILDIESKEEFKKVRKEIIDIKKEAIKEILEIRIKIKRRATTTEEILKEIHEENFDLIKRTGEVIKEVEEKILDVEEKISNLESQNIPVPQNAFRLLSNSKEHLAKSKTALEQEHHGEAFGQAIAALHNIKNAKRALERAEEDAEEETGFEKEKEEEPEKELKRNNDKKCIITGCSKQICDEMEVATTCEYLSEYACYETARCERQSNNECGWTQTEELKQCLERNKNADSNSDDSGNDDSDKIEEPETETIDMTAKQWNFNPSTIRVKHNTKVILNIKSIDVKHGFSLPEFNINVDLNPGQTQKVEFTAEKIGTFPFRCSVSCGAGHSTMDGTLVVF